MTPFLTNVGDEVKLEGVFKGGSAFLIANGPSLSTYDLEPLKSRWCMTLNNGPKTFRGNANCTMDDPARFSLSMWLDPTIMKFLPMELMENRLWDNRLLKTPRDVEQQWILSESRAKDCPNVIGYQGNEIFDAATWLSGDTINCGESEERGGGRSVMLPALRILYLLGFRRVYLLGADFEMSPSKKYHFHEERSMASMQGNNATYRKLQGYFEQLQPHFLGVGFVVKNCNPQSRLTAFPYVPYETALEESGALLGNFLKERTHGMYQPLASKINQISIGRPEAAVTADDSYPARVRWLSPRQRQRLAASENHARTHWLSPMETWLEQQCHRPSAPKPILGLDASVLNSSLVQGETRPNGRNGNVPIVSSSWLSPLQRRGHVGGSRTGQKRTPWLTPLQRRWRRVDGFIGPNSGSTDTAGRSGKTSHFQPAKATVAAIVTCHNYGRFLHKCLDSLLAQTVRFDYIHVVDDASEDETAAICREYEAAGISYEKGYWRNFTKARQAGVAALPRTRFLVFVDADNWLSPNFLESLLRPMDDPRVGVTYPEIHHVDAEGLNTGAKLVRQFSYHRLRLRNNVDACALIRTEAFVQADGWTDIDGLTDWLLWLNMTRQGWQMQLVNGAILYYRKHGENMHEKRLARGATLAAELDVLRHGFSVAIVTLFSGREWMLERYAQAIRELKWPKDKLRITAIDNSGRADFTEELYATLRMTGVPFLIVQDAISIGAERPDFFADNASMRSNNAYRLSEHLGRLYALARESMPAGSDLVWSIEDDIEVPSDALERFGEVLSSNRDAGVLSACVQSRFRQGLLAWQGNWKDYETKNECYEMKAPPPRNEAWPILAGGLMCTIFRREVWDKITFRPSPMWDDRRAWYDWAVGRDAARLGWKWLVLGSVHCRHWSRDGRCFEPPPVETTGHCK